MTASRVEEIKTNLRSKDTGELIEIWKANDRDNYADEAFEAIRAILVERSVALPPQSLYVWKDDESGLNMRRVDDLRKGLESRTTRELTEIWRENDRVSNTNETFEAIRQIFAARNVALPPQDRPGLRRMGKGLLYWGAFLLFLPLYRVFSGGVPATASLVLVAGGVIAFGLCYLWYRVAQVREQRSLWPRTIGRALFLSGTLVLVVSFEMVAVAVRLESHRESSSLAQVIFVSVLAPLLLPGVLLGAAFLLQYKRSLKPARKQRPLAAGPQSTANQQEQCSSVSETGESNGSTKPALEASRQPNIESVSPSSAGPLIREQVQKEWRHVKEKCPHCGELVAFLAETCPNCGKDKIARASHDSTSETSSQQDGAATGSQPSHQE